MGKKIILLIITLLLLYGCSDDAKVILNDEITVFVEIADDNAKITKGLMYREELDEDRGMLFIFNDEKPRTFWMKNTMIPLDIIFISKDYEIVKIQHAVPCKADPCKLYPSEKSAKYVLEVNTGFTEKHGIEEGMNVEISV